MAYDSAKEATMPHIRTVQSLMKDIVIPELFERAKNHDASKLKEPEKSMYDEYIPKLKTVKYGTPEYAKVRDEMAKGALSHHYENNRHHIEHYKNGIADMTLIDIMELMVDWVAASQRSDTTFLDGMKSNQKKYNLDDTTVSILVNTYNEFFK